jgi:hypothetical protein
MSWAGVVTAVGGALVLVVAAGKRFARLFKRASDVYDDWKGEPARPGVAPRPGMMVRLAAIEDVQRTILEQLQPNSGHSLRDAVDATRRELAEAIAAHLVEFHGVRSAPRPAPPEPRPGRTYYSARHSG